MNSLKYQQQNKTLIWQTKCLHPSETKLTKIYIFHEAAFQEQN